ncbi:WGxxGxxG family protein [Gloeocapsa sp. BRSZ]
MKRSQLSKVFGASVLGLSLAVLPSTLPVSAQTTNTAPGTTGTTTTTAPTTTTTTETNDGFDWGWLGLIGLAGLAGLAGGRKSEPTRYREPDTVGTTTSSTYREP